MIKGGLERVSRHLIRQGDVSSLVGRPQGTRVDQDHGVFGPSALAPLQYRGLFFVLRNKVILIFWMKLSLKLGYFCCLPKSELRLPQSHPNLILCFSGFHREPLWFRQQPLSLFRKYR